jgi:hypothetical protein
MRTDELIHILTRNLPPVSPLKARLDILVFLMVGAALSLLVMGLVSGRSLDMRHAAHGWPVFIKLIYTAPLCGWGYNAVQTLSLPCGELPSGGVTQRLRRGL